MSLSRIREGLEGLGALGAEGEGGGGWLKNVKTAGVTGVTTVAANVVSIWTALASIPYLAYLVLLLDVVLLGYCFRVLWRGRRAPLPAEGAEAGGPSAAPQRHPAKRGLAVLGVLILLPATLFLMHQLAPNRLAGRGDVHGSLCVGPREEPARRAVVDAIGATGDSVALREAEADDYGYFFLDLRPWARKPRHLLVSLPGCGTERIDLGRPARRSSQCGPVPEDAVPAGDRGSVWRLTCARAGPGP